MPYHINTHIWNYHKRKWQIADHLKLSNSNTYSVTQLSSVLTLLTWTQCYNCNVQYLYTYKQAQLRTYDMKTLDKIHPSTSLFLIFHSLILIPFQGFTIFGLQRKQILIFKSYLPNPNTWWLHNTQSQPLYIGCAKQIPIILGDKY